MNPTHLTCGDDHPADRSVSAAGRLMLTTLPILGMLMGFSIWQTLLDQPAMAAASGVAAVGLATEVFRRILQLQSPKRLPSA